MEVVDVSMAKAIRQAVGELILKVSLLSPSVPPPLSSFALCVGVLIFVHVFVFFRFEKSASNLVLPKPPSRRKKTLPTCSAPKGQPNVAFGLVLSAEILCAF